MAEAASKLMTTADLALLLAPAIGVERAKLAVDNAITLLGLSGATISEQDAQRVLTSLGTVGGLTSVAARRASATLRSRTTGERAPLIRNTSSSTLSAIDPTVRVSRQELTALLSHAVGIAAAQAAVDRCAARCGFGDDGSVDAALRVLELISSEPGLVGITARFAKARLLIRKGV